MSVVALLPKNVAVIVCTKCSSVWTFTSEDIDRCVIMGHALKFD